MSLCVVYSCSLRLETPFIWHTVTSVTSTAVSYRNKGEHGCLFVFSVRGKMWFSFFFFIPRLAVASDWLAWLSRPDLVFGVLMLQRDHLWFFFFFWFFFSLSHSPLLLFSSTTKCSTVQKTRQQSLVLEPSQRSVGWNSSETNPRQAWWHFPVMPGLRSLGKPGLQSQTFNKTLQTK